MELKKDDVAAIQQEVDENLKATDTIPPTAEEEARVIKKLDWHLMPMIFLIYMFSVMDRTNLGNAYVAGLDDSIDLRGNRYNWLGTSFYISCEQSCSTTTIVDADQEHRYPLPVDGCRLEALQAPHLGQLRRHYMGVYILAPSCSPKLCRPRRVAGSTWRLRGHVCRCASLPVLLLPTRPPRLPTGYLCICWIYGQCIRQRAWICYFTDQEPHRPVAHFISHRRSARLASRCCCILLLS